MTPRIFYVRNENKLPIGCIVYTVKDTVIKYAVSCCNLKSGDHPIKRVGREEALRRLVNDPYVLSTESDDKQEIFFEMLEDLKKRTSVPGTLRKLVKKYLNSFEEDMDEVEDRDRFLTKEEFDFSLNNHIKKGIKNLILSSDMLLLTIVLLGLFLFSKAVYLLAFFVLSLMGFMYLRKSFYE